MTNLSRGPDSWSGVATVYLLSFPNVMFDVTRDSTSKTGAVEETVLGLGEWYIAGIV